MAKMTIERFMRSFYPFVRRISRGIVALSSLALLAGPARAETPVAIELVLALDSSASMNREEFALQIKGLAAAFKDPAVLRAVSDLQPLGVAIAVTQWGGPGENRVVVPFTHITTPRQAKAFGFRAGRGSRNFHAATTSIATAIEESIALLETNDFTGQRLVIDISGDGIDNSGADLEATRNLANAVGVTVNGLAIESEQDALTDYYRNHVITGADSFVVKAEDFEDYARAIREKLLRELRPLDS
jgi:Protein of unknown function (DUF1194)